MNVISAAADWVELHPVVTSLLIWPVITAIVTWIWKPRTPEEYAAMKPWLAATLRFLGATGFDARKALEILASLVFKGRPPPPPSSPPEPPKLIWLPNEPPPTRRDPPSAARRRGTPLFVFGVAAIAAVTLGSGCGVFSKQNARDAMSVTKAACIVANALLPDDRVAAICGFVDTADPALHELLGKAREQHAAGRAAGAQDVGCR